MKLGGRLSKFWCEEGWNLAPATPHAMCKLGQWDRTIPVCVRPGCEKFKVWPRSKVKLTYEMDEAIARFECTKPWPELELIGNEVLSCDGAYWNGTLPACRKPPPTTVKPATKGRTTGGNVSPETSSSCINIFNYSDFRTKAFISVFVVQIFLFCTTP